MKISDGTRFPHPVLAESLADYVAGGFSCDFTQQLTSDDELKITANMRVTEPHLGELLDRGDAGIGFFVICRRTYYNVLKTASRGTSEHHLPATDLFGTVQLQPLVWATGRQVEIDQSAVHSEFGDDITVGRGGILAMGPQFRFSVDNRRFQPFESIFTLQRVESVPSGCIEVETAHDIITIGAESGTYDSIVAMRGIPAGTDILLGAVYLPAVMDVVAAIQTDLSSCTSCAWYSVLRAKCDELGINPADPSKTPLQIAQRLLKSPIKRTIKAMELGQ